MVAFQERRAAPASFFPLRGLSPGACFCDLHTHLTGEFSMVDADIALAWAGSLPLGSPAEIENTGDCSRAGPFSRSGRPIYLRSDFIRYLALRCRDPLAGRDLAQGSG